jgi:hypothetical protein
VTALHFPAEVAVGEVDWQDAQEPGGWGHLLAIGVVDVPDGTPVNLDVCAVAEVGVYGPDQSQRVTWEQERPDRAALNTRSIWGGQGDTGYYVSDSTAVVDLEFTRGLPASGVRSLAVKTEIVLGSFPAVAHLAPGLRHLTSTADCLDDQALSVVADLPALESLQLYGGSFTADGLQRLARLQNLQDLHIEKQGLPPSAFRFAASMPGLTRLTGPDEIPGSPMTPAELEQLRGMLPRIRVC